MNARLLTRLLVLALWLGVALPTPADELPDVSQISIEDARKELTAMDAIQRRDFGEAAMKSERKDLIELCMATPMANDAIGRAIRKMPDAPLRRELVLLLLRAPGIRWPDNPEEFTTGVERMSAVNGVTEYVGQYLPDIPITYEVIGSPERRRQLADAFEAAVTKVHAESPAAAGDPTNPRHIAGTETPQSMPGSGPAATGGAVATTTGSTLGGAYAGLWLGGVLLLGAAAAVWYHKHRTGRRPSRQR